MGGRARVYVGTALAVAAWAAALACVPHPSADPVCDGTSSVKGTHNAVFVAPTGDMPRAFKALPTNALLPLPGGRGYTVCPGTDDGSGHLDVPAVPDGITYLFQNGTVYVETAQRDVDFSTDFLGRPDALAATSTTPVTLNASNLESWVDANDAIGVFSWGARSYHFGLDVLAGPPSDGSTTMSLGFDWSQLRAQRLLDASKGDQLIVTQYANRTITGGNASIAIKRFILSNATLKNAQSSTLSGTFADINLSRNVSFNWALSQFDTLALDTAPDFETSSQHIFIVSEPAGQAHGFFDFAMDILSTGFQFSISTDKTLGASIPQPLAGFTHIVDAEEDLGVTRTFHGATESLNAFIYVEDLLDNVDRGTLKPVTGPVKSIKLNGQDWSNPLSGVGTTPVVSWQPVLSAQVYRVEVNRMKVATGGTVGHDTIATIFVSDPSVQIPDGIVMSGDTIHLFIDSMNSAGGQFDKTVFPPGEPTSVVRVVTQTFTP